MGKTFDGKTVIITGAGKGIGRGTAREMAARGAAVVAIARTEADLASLAEEIGCKTVQADIGTAAGARAAMAQAGPADYLVNCAGTNVLETVLEMTDAGYETVMGINLRAALVCAQEFARARVAAGGGGVILNVGSIAGYRGFEQHLCYAASKAGLDGATRVLAKELGPYGIRAVSVAPTITLTELAASTWSDPARSEPMMVRHPVRRFAEVEDVARAIAMLLSDDAAMITGDTVAIDGGFLAV